MTTSWSLSFRMRNIASVVIVRIFSRLGYCCVRFSLLLDLIVYYFVVAITGLYILRKNSTVTIIFSVSLRFWNWSRRSRTRSLWPRRWFLLVIFSLLFSIPIYRVIKVALGSRSWILLRMYGLGISISTFFSWVITKRSRTLPIRLIWLFGLDLCLFASTTGWVPRCWLAIV